MLPTILTKEFCQSNSEPVFKFIAWYAQSKKYELTQISIEMFFDVDFTIQLGYWLEWLASNGVYVVSYHNPLKRGRMLKLEYAVDANVEFKYYDLDEVNTNDFKYNPLETYELLIAMFITRLNLPF